MEKRQGGELAPKEDRIANLKFQAARDVVLLPNRDRPHVGQRLILIRYYYGLQVSVYIHSMPRRLGNSRETDGGRTRLSHTKCLRFRLVLPPLPTLILKEYTHGLCEFDLNRALQNVGF